MAKAREVKSRIANIKDIKQITKAMNAIAMATVTKLKKKLNRASPYYRALMEKREILLDDSLSIDNPLLKSPETEKIGVVTFNSDRGLAGNYTIDINRSTRDFIHSADEEVALFAGGDKGATFFRDWPELEDTWVNFYDDPEFKQAERIAANLRERFIGGEFSALWAVYMEFFSDFKQKLRIEKILPMSTDTDKTKQASGGAEKPAEEESNPEESFEDYLYEPDRDDLVDNFLNQSFSEKIYWIILNTKTSENAIRRRAMRDATDNANELIDKLTVTYNKARQQQITREIADIIGGAEALRGEE